jgi:N-acetylglucosaminyldiphosphoundecaprenol N-acetyl-beta-D-mannosaminyltransferase
VSSRGSARYPLFGVTVDALSARETVERCAELMSENRFVQHVVLNASKVVLLADDPGLREIVGGCDIVSADGMSVVWAGRALGVPFPERVTGIDLMQELLAMSEACGWPVYVLGATSEVLDSFLAVLRDRFPSLAFAGSQHGYFDDASAVAASIASSGARVLLVGMPSPRKERFLWEHRGELGPVFAMGVGGSLDVWAGRASRAPRWMQRSGLEWLYRLLQEPRRMWRRYLIGNVRFLLLVVGELLRPGMRDGG